MNNIIGANNNIILDVIKTTMLISVIIIALMYTGTVYYIFIIIMLLLFLCVCACVCNFIIICMCVELHTHITTYEYNSQLTIFKNGHTTHQLLNVKALS